MSTSISSVNLESSSPINSLIYFILLTIVYGILVIYGVYSKGTLEEIQNSRTNGVYTIIYALLILSGMYFTNLRTYQSVCSSGDDSQYFNVFIATLLPWIIIFGILYFVLETFDGWIRPFSNTIGYFIVNLIGIEDQISKIIKDKPTTTDDNTSSIREAIINIERNKTMVLNEFDHELQRNDDNGTDVGFIKNVVELAKSNLLKVKLDSYEIETMNNRKEIVELFKLVNIKFIIGKLIWYILAGSLIASISYNYIINMKCQQDINALDDFSKTNSPDVNDVNNQRVSGYEWRKYVDVNSNDINIEDIVDSSVLIDELKKHLQDNNSIDDVVTVTQLDLETWGISDLILYGKHYIKINNNTYYKPIA